MQTAPTIMLHAQQKDCNCANAAEGIGRPLAAELTSVGLVFILLNTVLMIVPIPENYKIRNIFLVPNYFTLKHSIINRNPTYLLDHSTVVCEILCLF